MALNTNAMNESERKTYEWLLSIGVPQSSLAFQPRRSPDFISTDGRCWEAKIVRERVVTFWPAQLRTLTAKCEIVIWPNLDVDAPDIVPFADITVPGEWNGYLLRVPREYEGETLNIRNIDADAVARAKRAAASRDMTLGEYVARLVDLHDAMRALADADAVQVGVELEALGLATVRS